MSPTVVQPAPLREPAVFSGSLWYSNAAPPSDQTVPGSPAGSSLPSSSRMCGVPSSAFPTDPRCASQSSESIAVSR